MKVNKNAPTFEQQSTWINPHELGERIHSNIPIRLEMATRIAAGMCAFGTGTESYHTASIPQAALELADALIKAHNETCEPDADLPTHAGGDV